MSTTVTYMGNTLTTVDNDTKTLETAGTWLEDDITLTDVSGGGGGGGLSSINLLDGCTYLSGYIGSSGSITSASATRKEVYSNYIDITRYAGDTLFVCAATPTSNQHWVACAFYDSNYTFKTRTVPINSVTNISAAASVSVPSDAYYMRVTFRTYGNIAIFVLPSSDMYQFIDDENGSVVTA